MSHQTPISTPQFTRKLMRWHVNDNKRKMPWKGEKDPYKIWLSEIILQQTRVEQGLAYYEKFIRHYPTVKKLAAAKDEAVMKLWEGLGYYSRCRNLIAAARFIANELKGKFPATYEDIQQLKGVGPYTAAAIASFAYNLPHAVVDGNVFRVLARVFGIYTPIDSTEGKKEFTTLAQQLLDKKSAALYNQAIMDFGATVCKPAAPLCSECVFKKNCVAFNNDTIATFPIKEKKLKIKHRWFYYLLIEHKGQVALQQRNEKDIWQGLYQFILIEKEKATDVDNIINNALQNGLLSQKAFTIKNISALYKQQLTHQRIAGQFIEITITKKTAALKKSEWVPITDVKQYAFPQFINQYLKGNR